MKVVGIIIEANPFHNGHQYFIDKVKNDLQPDVIIGVTSTSFSMRGDISVIDKFTKTKILLEKGFDIVLELPFFKTVQSADFFSKNAVDILSNLRITDIAFGIENTDFSFMDKSLQALNDYQENYKQNNAISLKNNLIEYLKNHHFTDDEINLFNSPNFTLGIRYLSTIREKKLNINSHFIKRIGNNYHDISITSNYPSATSLRKLLEEKKDISLYVPKNVNIIENYQESLNNLFTIIRASYLIHPEENKNYFFSYEGINNYIYKNGNFNSSYQLFLDSLKNKKYTLSRIKRTILHTLLKTNIETKQDTTYLRILGISQKGLEYINTLPKNVKNLLFSSPNEVKNFQKDISENLDLELKASRLYSILTNQPDLYLKEFTLPIRKEKL